MKLQLKSTKQNVTKNKRYNITQYLSSATKIPHTLKKCRHLKHNTALHWTQFTNMTRQLPWLLGCH